MAIIKFKDEKGIDRSAHPPLRAIRLKCLDCSCGNQKEVAECFIGWDCPLYPYRMGKKDPCMPKKKVKGNAGALAKARKGVDKK
ncbi:MAG: hypothetical protein WC476_00835 [Phycisphaerae bacterium]|jgi:hypothetical protein